MRTPRLRTGRPVWLPQRHATGRYPPLRGDHETDVAIVGGGLTGALTALRFAEHGARVIVVEAERIGLGSTAASTALLLQEPDEDLGSLSKRYGQGRARRIWQISRQACRDLIDTIRRLRISCGLVMRDSLYYTLDDDRARALQRELRARHAAGFGGRWLDAGALREASAIDGAGAIQTTGSAQVDPVRACTGLFAAAARSGAVIFERSPITRIRPVGDGVRLYSARGTIDAAQVVIATGYATRSFKPLAGRFKMRHTYVLATHRASEQQRRQLGIGPIMLWDTARPYHYVRWTADRRLLLGGADRPVKPGAPRGDRTAAIRELHQYFCARFPALDDLGIDRTWDGLFAMTPDGLPYIGRHRRYPRHTFALGYGGNGMTFAALAARILVEQWQGVRSPDHDLFAFNRSRS